MDNGKAGEVSICSFVIAWQPREVVVASSILFLARQLLQEGKGKKVGTLSVGGHRKV